MTQTPAEEKTLSKDEIITEKLAQNAGEEEALVCDEIIEIYEKPQKTSRERGLLSDCVCIPAAILYLEALLGISVGGNLSLSSFGYYFLFSVPFGLLIGLLTCPFKSRKTNTIITSAVLLALCFLYLVQYFIERSFKTYMSFSSVFSGGKDVANEFSDVVLKIAAKGIGMILLFLIPLILYVMNIFIKVGSKRLFAASRVGLKKILLCTSASLMLFFIGLAVVKGSELDRLKYTDEYSFDHAVKRFGLVTGTRLELVRSADKTDGESFVIVSLSQSENSSQSTSSESRVQSSSQSSGSSSLSESSEIPPKPVEYGENICDIDFNALNEKAGSDALKDLNAYVSSLPASKQNEYTGLFKGKNLILITAEAFSAEVIDENLTPTLYRLANNGIKFTDYYQPAWGGSTSTGEYANLMGLIPTNGVSSMTDTIGKNLYYTMGNFLTREGYHSEAFHNGYSTYYHRNETIPNFGYESFTAMGNGLEEGVKDSWPQSDLEMMQFTLPRYADDRPFSAYYMSVSGHCAYTFVGNSMASKNRDAVADMEASSYIKAYFACQLEFEYSLEYLVSELENRGIADDTVIVIATDHYPYGLEQSETWDTDADYLHELYGFEYSTPFERDHSALIIWSGCLENQDEKITVDTPVYSLDIIPTLANLFGVQYDSRLLVGRDVFSDAMPLAIWNDYSWKTDKGEYYSATGKFTPFEGAEVSDDYVDSVKAIVKNRQSYSKQAISLDYFDFVFGSSE